MTVRAFGPGRVNLIGEHTDYNDGLCLPFAIAAGVTVEVEPASDDVVEALAADLGETDAFTVADLTRADGWSAFVRGMVAELRAAGIRVRGGRLTIRGDVPHGGGLSSSAALEVALALALLAHSGHDEPDRRELARLCSRVENEWVGAQTGLLDQLASLLGREGHALRLDMRTLGARAVRLDLRGHVLAVLDSGAPRALADSGYNERRAECRRAAELLGVESLRDAGDPAGLPELQPRYNVAPSPPVASDGGQGGRRELTLLRWGRIASRGKPATPRASPTRSTGVCAT